MGSLPSVFDIVPILLAPLLAQAHFSAVTALSLSADGWTLLSAGRDKVAVLWDLRKYAKLATVPVHEAIEGARTPIPLMCPAAGPVHVCPELASVPVGEVVGRRVEIASWVAVP